MKILFLGRGVISTQYAWAFEKSGHTVEFYVRKGRKEQYGEHIDLEIWDARKNSKGELIKEKWKVILNEDISPNHDYDVIFVSVNPEQIADTVSYLSGRVGDATILYFNNFWKDPVESIAPLPPNQVVFGFPIGGGGIENNVLRGGFFKSVIVEKTRAGTEKRNAQVRELFEKSGFKVRVQKDMRRWLWNHFLVNAVMEAELLKFGNFRRLLKTPESFTMMGVHMKEIISIMHLRGTKPDMSTKIFTIVPPKLLGYLMSKFIFTSNSLPYLLMEYNNSKTGHSYKEVLDEVRRLKIVAPNFENSESLLRISNQ